MSTKNADKKAQKKQKRCQQIISAETNIRCNDEVSENIVICNAGLSTGLQLEQLLAEVNRFGQAIDVFMVPGKSYCFIRCAGLEESGRIYSGMHGQSQLAQNAGVLYLSYCDKVPNVENPWNQPLPSGLVVLKNFVTEEEEENMLQLIKSDGGSTSDSENENTLKHRIVKHFGFEFLYGTNNVDASKPLSRKIPTYCHILWPRLRENITELKSRLEPDQLTVNIYQPGQGIPPHVDTHSAFLDPICSLSLGSDVVMEFRQPTTASHVSVLLPRRSMLVIAGESRYGWTHGITPRKYDIVQALTGLSLAKREERVSFTFRWLQTTPCTCDFQGLCDTAKRAAELRKSLLVECPARLEEENVHRVYDEIASHFSETRHSPWPEVEAFVRSLGAGALMADIGCGNGKYLTLDDGLYKIGGDRSIGLLNVCRERGLNVFQCDCLYVPLRDESMDGCISIAVVHHLASKERRVQAVGEMARVLRVGGRALIYVWAKNQAKDSRQSSYLRQNKRNLVKATDNQYVDIKDGSDSVQYVDGLPVHTNRTQFVHQDMLVPWKLKSKDGASADFLRFYHVFDERELEQLVEGVVGVQVIRSYYDQGNWCVIFEKVK